MFPDAFIEYVLAQHESRESKSVDYCTDAPGPCTHHTTERRSAVVEPLE